MGFLDGILTDSLGSQGNQPDPSQSPAETGRSTAGMLLSGLGAVTGISPFSALGGMFNAQARLKFLEAQRPNLLKLAQDEGIIDQKKADFLQQMPIEGAMPDLHDIDQQLFAQKATSKPWLFKKKGGGFDWIAPGQNIPQNDDPYEKGGGKGYTAVRMGANGQLESVQVPAGQDPPAGYQPSSVFGMQQKQQDYETTLAATQAQRADTNAIRTQGQQIMEGLRQQGLSEAAAQHEFNNMMMKARLSEQQESRFSSEESKLLDQQKNIAAMSANKAADPTTIATMQGKQNAAMKAFKARADAAGYETSSEFDPVAVKDKPGALQKMFGVGPMGSSLVPPPGLKAAGADPLIGKATKQPDGTYSKGGKTFVVKGGRIISAY